MKTIKNSKRISKSVRIKNSILQNNLVKRYLRDIQKEESLDNETLRTIFFVN